MRRYKIHADWQATWVLVSDGTGWYVKRLGLRFSRRYMSVEAFEQSYAGSQLRSKFQAAVERAMQDI